ncbi:helix-turn-helix transcriptional regulator [Wenzhouxiangella limi]|uniref:Helix-turn-helix domain-containing protein n=1 Tax=Wenzhouxiangella limi TaxID=2707351 RepID=A0A845UYS8_9GAMM|nr:hypothetical protein [Wenzhouxiangella limi]NDY96983.1 hypothetical protein [Wenzhouxiangella limi]
MTHNAVTGMPPIKHPLTIPQIAKRWGRHPSTIYRNIKSGNLPKPIRICGRDAFTPAQIEAIELGGQTKHEGPA